MKRTIFPKAFWPLLLLCLALPFGLHAQTAGPKSVSVERIETGPATGSNGATLGSVPTLQTGLSAAPGLNGSLGALSAAPRPVENGAAAPATTSAPLSRAAVAPALPAPLTPSALPHAPAAAPAAAAPPSAVPPASGELQPGAETALETVRGQPNRLGRRIDEARALWAASLDRSAAAATEAYSPSVAKVSFDIEAQIAAMAAIMGNANDPILAAVVRNAHGFLRTIDRDIKSGVIDPSAELRTSASDSAKPASRRPLRVGIYPVAGDPLHWAHILIGLQAMAQLKLDKVVFVLAGDDPRKPSMTKAAIRHPLGRAVLDGFKPFFAYSDIAVGTDYDGETNIFRMLALNPKQRMSATYLVGDDHYKLKNAKGDDDTIPKLEKNRLKPELGFDSKAHEVAVAFIEREGHAEAVPTKLDVRFLPAIEFEASSSAVRKEGRYALMPYSAYDYVRRHKLGLYGIPPADAP